MDAVKSELTSTRTKLFYGVGSVAFGVKDNGFQTILLLFYNQVIHLPSQLVGLALAIALVADAFLDPVVGQFSDNLRTRWGRRHPLMYASALPVAVSYLLLWNPPHWSAEALFIYLIAVAILVRSLITFYEIPSSALAPELTADYDQRTSFLSYRLFFSWYGGMTMYALAFLVFLAPDATHKEGQLNAVGYSHYGITAAVVMVVAILVSAAGTHKFIPYLRKPEMRKASMRQYLREMGEALSNPAFLTLMSAGIFFFFATGLVFALNIYLLTYFWELDHIQIFVLSLSTFLAVFFAFLIAVPLSKRFGKRKGAVLLFSTGLVISVTPLGLRLLGFFPPNGASSLVPLLFGFNTVAATLTIASSIMMVSMLADVVEDSELKTGRRSEGLFFAGNSFLQKTASGLGLLGSGMLLWVVGFPNNAVPGAVNPATVTHFATVYLLIVFVLYGVATAIISRFPITRERHEENLRRLAQEAGHAAAPIATDLEIDNTVITPDRVV